MKKKLYFILVVFFILSIIGIYSYKQKNSNIITIKLEEDFSLFYGNILKSSDGYFVILKAINSKTQDISKDFLFYILKIDNKGNLLWKKTLNENILKEFEIPFVYKDNLYFLALDTRHNYSDNMFFFERNNLFSVGKSGEIKKVLTLDAYIEDVKEIKQIKNGKFILSTIDKVFSGPCRESDYLTFWEINLDKKNYSYLGGEEIYYFGNIKLTDKIEKNLYKFYSINYGDIEEIILDATEYYDYIKNRKKLISVDNFFIQELFVKDNKFYLFGNYYEENDGKIDLLIINSNNKKIMKKSYSVCINNKDCYLYPEIKNNKNTFIIYGRISKNYKNIDTETDEYFILLLDKSGKLLYKNISDKYIYYDVLLKDNKIVALASEINGSDNKILVIQYDIQK